MSNRLVDISIIIVNYKTRNHLQKCLISILDQNGPAFEIIVIDNNSNDGSVEMIQSQFLTVKLICNSANEGFSKANNKGLQLASGRYALILNPDTELAPAMLSSMISLMDSTQSISAAGCKVKYPDGSDQLSCGRMPNALSALTGGETLNIIFRKLVPNRNLPGAIAITSDDLNRNHDVEVLLGACFIVRMNVLRKIGFFDENMFMYFEECELFDRIRRDGGRIVFTPVTSIIHHAGGSLQKANFTVTVSYYLKNQEYFLRKVHNYNNLGLFRVTLTLVSICKSVLFLILLPLIKTTEKPKFQKRMAWQNAIILYYFTGGLFRPFPKNTSINTVVA